jgi:hypothetical protein
MWLDTVPRDLSHEEANPVLINGNELIEVSATAFIKKVKA